MTGVDAQAGRLECPCGAKLGAFNWCGLECSCGGWQSPGFQIHDGRLDRLPIAAPPVGGAVGPTRPPVAPGAPRQVAQVTPVAPVTPVTGSCIAVEG